MKPEHKYLITIIFILGLQIMQSCKISKDLPITSNIIPKNYLDRKDDTVSIAKIPWKIFFKDPILNHLLQEGIANNNDLAVAVKNIETAAQVVSQVKLGNYPAIALQISANLNRPSENSLNGLTLNKFLQTSHIEDYTAAPVISWEADLWGKIKSQKAIALASYLQTEEAKKVIQTKIVSDIAHGYYNLITLDAQLEVAKKNVLLSDSALKIIVLQFQSGLTTSLAVQQASAQKMVAVGLIPQFEKQIVIQENGLNILIGKNPGPVKRSRNLEDLKAPDSLDAGLPSELLSRRPDVKLSELALSKANADVGFKKANLYPSLKISAQGGINAFKVSNWFNIPASLFGTVAGGITQPIFQQRALKTQYEIANINRQQAVIHFRQSILVAVSEVTDALISLEKTKEQEKSASQRTKTLQEATQNSRLLFQNGMANYLEVITAQNNVLQTEIELVSIKKLQLDASVDLYRSLGGGWQ
ncbi:TolC family protein [Dyadobacter subterraneus]|uniref:TolC family protein n=1 Tax=Dyadobacter subterraneus TaxID=2773304 RepID=A0ABR9WMA1_9BACT|nr:TolC family protein [Dyadobacter subterraneus]MBE9466647.1 TolC family protein [Dyadobacter subterraneus]